MAHPRPRRDTQAQELHHPRGRHPTAWRGEGFLGADPAVVTLDQGAWERVTGSYQHLSTLSLVVELSSVVINFDVDDLSAISDLPPGDFVDAWGETTTKAEFEANLDELVNCEDY